MFLIFILFSTNRVGGGYNAGDGVTCFMIRIWLGESNKWRVLLG